MYQHGLGIEHEIRMRFTKEVDIKEIIKESDMRNIDISKYSKYLFINTIYLVDYFNKTKRNILLNFNKSMATNKEELDFAAKNILKRKVIDMAIKKKKYPFNDKNFYVFTYNNKIYQELFEIYHTTYLKYHYPLMYFKVKYKKDKIYTYIYKLPELPQTKEDFKSFSIFLKDFYNGKIYKDHNNQFKNIVRKSNNILRRYDIDEIILDYYSYVKNKKFKYKDIKSNILNTINNEILNDNFNFILTDKEYKILYLLDKKNEPHDDYSAFTSSVEFITIKYKNRKYLDSLNELIRYENLFYKIINDMPILHNLVDKYGSILPHNTGSVGLSIQLMDENINSYILINEDYTGSYHVWVTPFYQEITTPIQFVNILTTLSNKLQLLEPLLAAHFTSPSVFAIGNNLHHSRMSLRQELNVYGGYGGSDIMLLKGSPYSQIQNYYINDNLEKGVDLNRSVKLYDNISHKHILSYNGLTGRDATNYIFNTTVQYGRFNKNLNLNKKNIINYFHIVFSKYNLKFDPNINIGADIRTRTLNDLFEPILKKNYSIITSWWNGKFYRKFIKEIKVKDKIVKKIVEKAEYNIPAYKKLLSKERVGIEFRIFDHFPTPYIKQFLSILAPIMYQSSFEVKNITNDDVYTKQQFWHNEMANVMINGFEYKISDKYRRILEKEFNIKINNYKNTEEILFSIYDKLDHKYINKELYQKIRISVNREDFININKLAWFDTFKTYLQNNPKLYNKIMKIKETRRLTYSDIYRVFGKHFKYDTHRIKYYFDNIWNYINK